MNNSTSFERRLSGLFDRQRFFCNPALDALIAETESRCFGGRSLDDDDLELVSAAGESDPLWDDSILDETMPIIPADDNPVKPILQNVFPNDPSKFGRTDP